MELRRPANLQRYGHRRAHDAREHPADKRSFYVLAWVGHNKMLWGPYDTQGQAQKIGMNRTNGNYEIIPLDTSDLTEASRLLREQGIYEEGLTPSSFNRIRHKP